MAGLPQVWARELAGGDKAVILYNDGSQAGSELNITVAWADLGCVQLMLHSCCLLLLAFLD
jgi:hypothetical protein